MNKLASFLIFILLLTGLYFYLFIPAKQGWGYPSYGNYYRGGSFFYWSGADYYYDRDLRNTRTRGGGVHSGK